MNTVFYVECRTLTDGSKVYDVMVSAGDDQPVLCVFTAKTEAQAEQIAVALNSALPVQA